MDKSSIFTDVTSINRSSLAIRWFTLVLLVLFATAPFWPSIHFFAVSSHYLPLHAAMEIFAVVIAALVFAVGWNTHSHERSDNFLILACAFLAVGLLDFLHTMSYTGMPDFVTPSSAEKAINFWLAARLIVAMAILTVAIRSWEVPKKILPRAPWLMLALFLVGSISWIILYRPEIMPHTFIAGEGLTAFKIGSEYLIVTVHLLAAYLLWQCRNVEQGINTEMLAAASVIMGLAELFFTLYTTLTDFYNLAGHVYKVIAYIMIYQVIFVSSVKEPYQRLQQSSLRRLKLTQFAVDHSLDMVFWIDANGRIVNCNEAAQLALGYRLAELTNLQLQNIEHSLLYQAWTDMWEEIKNHKQLHRESALQTSIGTLIPVEINGNYVNAEETEYVCLFIRDISERKQTENILRNSEARLKDAQKIVHMGSWDLDLVNDRLTWSDEIFSLYEIDPANFNASYQGFVDAIHPDDRASVDATFKKSIYERSAYQMRHRILLKGGRVKHVLEHGETRYSEEGQAIRTVGTVQDITATVESEQALKLANSRLIERADELVEQQEKARLLNDMSELLLTCLSAEECYQVTANFCQQLFIDSSGGLFILDQAGEQAKSMGMWGDHLPSERQFEASQCWTLRRNHENQIDEPNAGLICSHIKKVPEAGYIGLPISTQGELMGVMELFWPACQLQLSAEKRKSTREFQIKIAHTLVDHLALSLINLRLRDSLRKQAIHDPLTGLYNRRYLDDALSREVRRAVRRDASFGIIMIDIDYFKQVNDQYGHDAGDVLLKEVAILFQTHLRGEDLVCRYGGEEFVAILPEADIIETTARAEEIRKVVEERVVEYAGQQISVTISAGVSMYSAHGKKAHNLIKAADDALYRAKTAGRNRVETADPEG